MHFDSQVHTLAINLKCVCGNIISGNDIVKNCLIFLYSFRCNHSGCDHFRKNRIHSYHQHLHVFGRCFYPCAWKILSMNSLSICGFSSFSSLHRPFVFYVCWRKQFHVICITLLVCVSSLDWVAAGMVTNIDALQISIGDSYGSI